MTNASNFLTMNEPIKRLKVVLDRVKIYDCKDCLQGFLSHRDYLLHQVQHKHKQILNSRDKYYNKDYESRKVNKCEECGLKFVLKSTLEAHLVVHTPYPHICHCGIGYYSSRDLGFHKKLVHENINQKLSVSKEDIEYKSQGKQSNLKRNLDVKPRFKADVIFKQKSKRKKGNIRKRSNNGRIKIEDEEDANGDYACPVCAKTYNERDKLIRHLSDHCDSRDLKCVLCEKKFTQAGSVKLHLMRHTGIKDEKCSYCGKTFADRYARTNHERIHTGVKTFGCKYCGKMFCDPSALLRHERIHTGDKRYKCQYCTKAFTDAGAALRHRLTHDTNRQTYACERCDKKFTAKYYLKHHMNVHKKEKNYQCDICSKWFLLKEYLRMHITMVHFKQEKYECDQCGKKFQVKQYLQKHFESKHDNKYYQCGDCVKNFKTQRDLVAHKWRMHRSIRFMCNDCPNLYTTKSELLRHIKKHLNIKCERCSSHFHSKGELEKHKRFKCFKCLKCDRYFSSVLRRTQHYETFHLKRIKHEKCDICDKYTRADCINKHKVNFHSTVKEYQCDYCKQLFPLRAPLRAHILKQHMLALYCDTCLKPFYTESEFQRHKKVGCQIKIHPCEICSRDFTSLTSLRSHLVVHCDRYNFVCDICNDKFKRKCSLKRHIKLVHGGI